MIRQLHKVLLAVLPTIALLLGIVFVSRVGALATSAKTDPHLSPVIQADADFQTSIRAASGISIPFGIQLSLPLGPDGHSVVVRGHGGCTENELVTIEITVTHMTAPVVATGQKEVPCMGALQHWSLIASADIPLPAGLAEACGLATTRADDVTDSYAWCRNVDLAWRNVLPLVLQSE